MEQINPSVIYAKTKTAFPWIAFLTVSIIFFFYFNNTKELSVENKDLKEKAIVYEKNAKDFVIKANVYETERKKNKTELQNLKTENDNLSKQLVNIKIQYNEKIKIVNRYSISDLQQYFIERYSSK